MKKFMDVDLIQSLKAVLQQNTGFYQSDFEIDRQILARAASEPEGRDRTFLWLSRPCGTHCLRECEVFLKGSPAYGVWQFFGNRNHNGVLAYAAEITHDEDDKILGNLYELDFGQHSRHVEDKALPTDYVRVVYDHGSRKQPVTKTVSSEEDLLFGKYLYSEYQTNESDAHRHILREEKQDRDRFKQGDFQEHIVSLRIGRIETEAKRIVEKIRALEKPNSSDGNYFMAELSTVFTALASSEDLESLDHMMPYKEYSFSEIKGWHGRYIFVAKEENRNRNIRKIQSRKKERK
ncbi:hypothetical protein EBB54_13525 [Schaedlerella arabinosiphila]|uniref:Uncharacterized protein n=1 Tax=Schaedlerella arabinosiphila TaxID=2044587 RepID=A0A3R8JML3_9FIRM|nr:hypothetical protein [Schaedlerella arabinosiphila]RRK32267.1 hypothetical protein EBB54_13525 [Schaedlerella arabinosiphila]